jgi:hypothetical protein
LPAPLLHNVIFIFAVRDFAIRDSVSRWQNAPRRHARSDLQAIIAVMDCSLRQKRRAE